MGIAVYVTHDQAEAMVISDRIAVMDSGNVCSSARQRSTKTRQSICCGFHQDDELYSRGRQVQDRV
jgi:ABC-type sugar transport system ATPase subunit